MATEGTELAAAPAPATQTSSSATSELPVVNIGTRRSVLARVQTDIVEAALKEAWPGRKYAIHAMATMGDKNQTTALHEFGAKSLWTHELEALLAKGELDMIVHSLKDMPTQLPPGMAIGAIFPREDPRDAFVLKASLAADPATASTHATISSLPAGSVIGTSSVRRSAQLKRLYPHLRFADVRGNVGTRLAKLDSTDPDAVQYTALILAAAGLKRLGLQDRITSLLSKKEGGMLHAVGQGALGIEVRSDDKHALELLSRVGCERTARACLAERSLMRTLEGGCSVPIGVETEWLADDKDDLIMRAVVTSLDGADAAEVELTTKIDSREAADEFGRTVAAALVERGASAILEKINLNRDIVKAQGDA
ncbi:putative porphobilinogen deaminase protein [Lasiodiplodia theobromae]|uniref:Porphobilinogen deaminase n=1 Tax=Lasiodiplodia theobromae TaxID=45133 RepID=A0A5N5D5Y3_9PEZI|nr:Porphobilinogen deaminase [Lasiodiplodia theobromae]KAB2573176.1 Porphobilinogen deaminase [Lasiodiplodia theobromae]KAF4543892.1 Porphobilinogen deaminase [Lasiodiplodia theobromae]KAF9629333.1 putative porphobilinogen deaminase protein [Lasiodiplodia theobromae]